MNLLIKIVVIICTWFVGNIILSEIIKIVTKKNHGIHIDFIGSIIKLTWLIIIISIIMDLFPQTKKLSSTLLTSSGLLVAVAGFAAQQVLADVISGIMLSWAKPFDIGEKITISELEISGIVESMTIRHTIIKTYHNSRLIVPNSVINKSVIENSNYDNSHIGNYLEISISYDSNLDEAIRIMEEIVSEHDLVISQQGDKEGGKKASVLVKDLSEDGIILKCTIWTKNIDDNFVACSDIRKEIKRKFEQAGIKIHLKKLKVVN